MDTLVKYLDNIINNPADEKYRKIRNSNKAFTERVASLEGTDIYLSAVGFQPVVEDADGQEYWKFPKYGHVTLLLFSFHFSLKEYQGKKVWKPTASRYCDCVDGTCLFLFALKSKAVLREEEDSCEFSQKAKHSLDAMTMCFVVPLSVFFNLPKPSPEIFLICFLFAQSVRCLLEKKNGESVV